MNIIEKYKKTLKATIGIEGGDLDRLTSRERQIWDSSDYVSGGGSLSRTIESRLAKKLPLAGLVALYLKTNGYRHSLASIQIEYAFIKLLVLFNAIDLSNLLARRLVPRCLKYHMLHEGYYLTRLLKRRYANSHAVPSWIMKNNTMLCLFKRELDLEYHAEDLYTQVLEFYRISKGHTPESIEIIRDACGKLSGLQSEVYNPRFIFFKHSVLLFQCEIENSYSEAVSISNEAINRLKLSSIVNPASLRAFVSQKVNACTQLKDYQKAEETLSSYHGQFNDNTYNYLRYNEQLLILLLKQLKLEDARIILGLIKTLDYQKYGTQITERIITYELYIKLLTQKSTNLHFYINKLPRTLRDSKGMNLAIEAAILIDAAIHRDFEYITIQNTRIDKYLSVHARANGRTKLFIRLLLQLPLAQTDWTKWKSINNRLYSRLIKSTDSVEELEIIDYEVLWPFISKKALSGNKSYERVINNPLSIPTYEINLK